LFWRRVKWKLYGGAVPWRKSVCGIFSPAKTKRSCSEYHSQSKHIHLRIHTSEKALGMSIVAEYWETLQIQSPSHQLWSNTIAKFWFKKNIAGETGRENSNTFDEFFDYLIYKINCNLSTRFIW